MTFLTESSFCHAERSTTYSEEKPDNEDGRMRYHKVLDIHLTGNNGEANFPYATLEALVVHAGGSEANIGGNMQAELMVREITPGRLVKAVKPFHDWHDALSIVVTYAELDRQAEDPLYRSILTSWLMPTDEHPNRTSKIRFFAHGDGLGNVAASGGSRPIPTNKFVDWLDANKLPKSGVNNPNLSVAQNTVGLATLALASCLGGRHGLDGGVYNAAAGITPAQQSAVAQLVRALRAKDYRGIEVTGTTEMLEPLGPQAKTGWHWQVELFKSEWKITTLPGGQAQIEIPRHWTLNANGFRSGGTIGFPQSYTLVRTPDGWRVTPASGAQPFTIPLGSWVVDPQRKQMALPVGWTVTPAPAGGGTLAAPHGSSVFHPPPAFPNMNPRAEGRLSGSPQKVHGGIS